MRKSWAEYKRESRRRERERKRNEADETFDALSKPFSEFLADGHRFDEVAVYLEWAGIDGDALPSFEDDTDPEHDPENDPPNRGSLGRAERMVGMFMDAASELARLINEYKRKEISARIQELENSSSLDAHARQKARGEIDRLKRMLNHLNKQVRWTFPQWKVTGE